MRKLQKLAADALEEVLDGAALHQVLPRRVQQLETPGERGVSVVRSLDRFPLPEGELELRTDEEGTNAAIDRLRAKGIRIRGITSRRITLEATTRTR